MNNTDYNKIESSVRNWLNKKEEYELRRNLVFGIGPKVYLTAFAVLFLYIFYFMDRIPAEVLQKDNANTASNFTMYAKPNNSSEIILRSEDSSKVTIIGETKFYYKVELQKQGKLYQGYINKENIIN